MSTSNAHELQSIQTITRYPEHLHSVPCFLYSLTDLDDPVLLPTRAVEFFHRMDSEVLFMSEFPENDEMCGIVSFAPHFAISSIPRFLISYVTCLSDVFIPHFEVSYLPHLIDAFVRYFIISYVSHLIPVPELINAFFRHFIVSYVHRFGIFFYSSLYYFISCSFD
jgi:hypothetical protein